MVPPAGQPCRHLRAAPRRPGDNAPADVRPSQPTPSISPGVLMCLLRALVQGAAAVLRAALALALACRR